jgi:polyisoprenoid-binding protein YceI
MKWLILVLAYFVISLSFVSPPPTWEFDQPHSNLRFTVTHLMVSDIQGSVQIKEAKLTTPNDDFSDASVYVLADMNSIDTDNDQRDDHLRTAEFFDTEKYPSLTFQSDSFKKVADNKYTVTGLLTFHGISKETSLDVIASEGEQPWDKKSIVGFKVSGTIHRSDFGIGVSTPSAILSEDVTIIANVIFAKS